MDDSRFFSFLRYSLHLTESVDAEGIDWPALRAFGERHTLVGVLFEGLRRLPKEQMPVGNELFQWIGQSENIRKANGLLDRASVLVYKKVTEAGHACCILKGQGNALMYPAPGIRTPGDVDVWVNVYDRAQLRRLAHRLESLGLRLGEETHAHIGMDMGGIAVELHPWPALLCNPWRNAALRRWFDETAAAQFAHVVHLPGGVGGVAVPTAGFNMVYQLLHILHHYFFEGIGLRQLADYTLLLRQAGPAEASACHGTLARLGLRGFAGALMWTLHEVFGLDEALMVAPMDARRGRPLLADVLQGGNFGHADTRFAHTFIGHNLQRLDRDLRLLRHYPSEILCEPWYRAWHFLWRKTR